MDLDNQPQQQPHYSSLAGVQGDSVPGTPPLHSSQSSLSAPEAKSRYMPDLPQRTLVEGNFKWHIQSFSNLRAEALNLERRKVHSPVFRIGQDAWTIMMFPFGNDVDCLSLYIDFVQAKEMGNEKWHRCVQFAVRIYNVEDESVESFQSATHRFTTEETDWGFTRFIRLSDLSKPLPSHSRPILERDQFVVEAFVRIIEDETGTLWHNFVDWNSKVETGYVGLKNQGATCYMNSLLQSLYFTSPFRQAVYKIPTEGEQPGKSVVLALQRLFYQLQTAEDAVDTRELTKSFGWDTLDAFMQHDVQEFNRVLQDNLETKMKGTEAEGAIEKLFVGKMKSYIKCVNVDYESSREETYYDIQLNVKGKKDLYESFKDYVAVEMLDGENKYQSEKFGLQDAKKGVIFTSFPPVLHLQMKRFEYDFERDAMVKINDRHEYPLTIDLTEFLDESVPKTSPQIYHLHGVLVHIGDVHGGHYCAYIRPNPNGKWFKFDDDRVTPVTSKEVLEDNYGGDWNATGYPLNKTARLHKRFTNAYMLVYVRESDIASALAPPSEADIPRHLIESLRHEQEERDRLAREAIERHLYMDVQIATAEMAKSQQTFDLVNWGENSEQFIYLKAKKTDLWKDFKKTIAERVQVPVERIRLWSLYRRQNHTIRPENSLDGDYDEQTVEEVYMNSGKNFNNFRLYLEIAEHQVQDSDGKIVYFPSVGKDSIVIFVKYYEPETTKLEYLGPVRVKLSLKGQDLIPIMTDLKKLPPSTNIAIYEEVKPGMVDPLKLQSTLAQSELVNGDILCFQKNLDKDMAKRYEYPFAPNYYDYLMYRITLTFVPKNPPRDDKEAEKMKQAGIPFAQVDVQLSRKMTYDQMVTRVGTVLNFDGFKLRLMINPTGGDSPKAVVKRVKDQTLHEILTSQFYGQASSFVFWYDVSDISILDLETNKLCKVIVIDEHMKETDSLEVLVPKTGTFGDLALIIAQKLRISESLLPKLRIFEAVASRDWKLHKLSTPVSELVPDQYGPLYYVEKIPEAELEIPENCKRTVAFHFAKEPQRAHGIPFPVQIHPDDTVGTVRARLQARLGMSDKEFSKVKLFVVDHTGESAALDKEDSGLFECWQDNYLLGLEHPDRSASSRRFGGFEKAIKIHN